MTLNKTIYRQYDSRWKNLPYPGGGYYLNGSGCGCLAVTHCVIEIPRYAQYTPKNVQPYMKQFARKGEGTLRDGITKGLINYGYSEVIRLREKPMTILWKEAAKGSRAGVLLLLKVNSKGKVIPARGPDGTVWTNGGHYVAFTGYKVKDGKHYLYIKDSGSRRHDGWYCYEKSIRGCVMDAWVGKIPGGNSEKKSETTPTVEKKSYSGAYPNVVVKETSTVSEGAKLVKKADTFCWAYGTDKKKWSYGSGAPRDIYKSSLNKYLKKTAKISQSDCGYFVTVCVRSAALSNTFRTLEWGDKLPSNCKVVHSGKSVPANALKPGDIIRYKKKNGAQHTMIFYSNGKVAEAGRKIRFPIIQKDTKKYNASNVVKSSIQVLRFVTTKTVTRSYLHKGDKGGEIEKLQLYLNWYDSNNKLEVDGGFGELTRTAVINFQNENGLEADGTVGEKTLAKMKMVTK